METNNDSEQMVCREVLEKRIVFLSGKGGVGKSVVAAALGRIAARRGRRTLLVELDTMETIPGIFGKPQGRGYHEIQLSQDLSCLHVDGQSGLEEYLQMVVKSKRFLKRMFRSPLYQYFVNIAPGLKELMAVGKLWDLQRKMAPQGERLLYDLIIVDTPATGHTISYLQMPMTAAGTVKKGFVKKEAQKVVDLLRDPDRTSFNIVTTLGEMPVNEAMELYETVSVKLGMPVGCVFVNQAYPPFYQGPSYEAFSAWREQVQKESPETSSEARSMIDKERMVLACAESWRKRRAAQDLQQKRLRQGIPRHMVNLPFVYQAADSLDLVRQIEQSLEQPPSSSRNASKTRAERTSHS